MRGIRGQIEIRPMRRKQKKERGSTASANRVKPQSSDNPALPIPSQQPQHLPLTHGVLTSELQNASGSETIVFSVVSCGREF